MAKLGNVEYDENEFDRNRAGYVPLPDGTYNVEIVEAAQKKWEDGGVQLGITYKVIDGENEGKIFFDNLQLVNSAPDVQGIARAALHKICDNLEINWPLEDDEFLLGGMMTIVLKSKTKGDKTYQNVVSREPLQTGKVRQVNKAASPAGEEPAPEKKQAAKTTQKAAAKKPAAASKSSNDAPW